MGGRRAGGKAGQKGGKHQPLVGNVLVHGRTYEEWRKTHRRGQGKRDPFLEL